jgi:hypothetical protein
MKLKSIIAAAALMIPATVHANLGDNYAQCCKRWGGLPYKTDSMGSVWSAAQGTLSIRVHFDKSGRCTFIQYIQWGTPLSNEQMLTFVSGNIPRKYRFHEIAGLYGRGWATDDGTINANEAMIQDHKTGATGYCLIVATLTGGQEETALIDEYNKSLEAPEALPTPTPTPVPNITAENAI